MLGSTEDETCDKCTFFKPGLHVTFLRRFSHHFKMNSYGAVHT